jgi:hypothetical protein
LAPGGSQQVNAGLISESSWQGGIGSGSVGDDSGSGEASVYGQVWLDNNGDGMIDNGEMGYSGITVALINASTGDAVATTTTNSNGDYNFKLSMVGPATQSFEIQVYLNSVPYLDFQATLPGVSQINAQGYSGVFQITAGGWRDIEAGICSLTVTTLDDDPNGVLPQDQDLVTLRDAIETANNGDGLGQGSGDGPAIMSGNSPTVQPMQAGAQPETIDFVNANPLKKGQALTGILTMQNTYEPLKKNVNIVGPGANLLTIQAQANANNPFRVFQINVGDTTTISGLTITGGYLRGLTDGAGIENFGKLTLDNDVVTKNQTTDDGGGIDNEINSTLIVENTSITSNTAGSTGGGIENDNGTLSCYNTLISNNTSNGIGGGGLANQGSAAKAFLLDNTVVSENKAPKGDGGGIYNAGQAFLSMENTSGTTFGASINGNSAEQGGGIYVLSGTVHIWAGIDIYKNQAIMDGGGVYVSGVAGGIVTISEGWIANNSALTGNGGGIYNWEGTLTLQGGEYIGKENSAPKGKGGGLYLHHDSTTTFNNVTVEGNTAKNKASGFGVYWQKGATVRPNPPGPALTDKDDPGGTPVTGT